MGNNQIIAPCTPLFWAGGWLQMWMVVCCMVDCQSPVGETRWSWIRQVCLRVLVLWNSWMNWNRSKWQNAREQWDWGLNQCFWAWQSLKWAFISQWNIIRCAFRATASVTSSTRTVSSGGMTRTQATTGIVTPKMAIPRALHRHRKKLEIMHPITPGHNWVWLRPTRSWMRTVWCTNGLSLVVPVHCIFREPTMTARTED